MNSERFLAAFNKIEQYLKEQCNASKYDNFSKVLPRVASRNKMVAHYKEQLEKYSDLRNIIIHEQFKPNYIIAEPHTEIVEAIERIVDIFAAPPKIIPKYKRVVTTFNSSNSISEVLKVIRDQNLSQFPIYDCQGEFIGLLTERCIAHWLALNVSEDIISLQETTVEDVLKYDETEGNNVVFLKREDTVFDAYNIFIKETGDVSQYLEAILITEHGRRTESLQGIITRWEVIGLFK